MKRGYFLDYYRMPQRLFTCIKTIVLFTIFLVHASNGNEKHLRLKGNYGWSRMNPVHCVATLDDKGHLIVIGYFRFKGISLAWQESLAPEKDGVFANETLLVAQKGKAKCSDLSRKKKCMKMEEMPDHDYNSVVNELGFIGTYQCSKTAFTPKEYEWARAYIDEGSVGIRDSMILEPNQFLDFYLRNLRLSYQKGNVRALFKSKGKELDSNIVREVDSCAEKNIVDLPNLNRSRKIQ